MQAIRLILFSKLKIEIGFFFFDYRLVKAIGKGVQITNETTCGTWEIILQLGSAFSLAFSVALRSAESKCIYSSVEHRPSLN